MAVSYFSKTLAVLVGLGIWGVQVSLIDVACSEGLGQGVDHQREIADGSRIGGRQFLANRGINIIPTAKLQQYVKGINWRSALEDNAAFKLSFGATFALASLAEF